MNTAPWLQPPLALPVPRRLHVVVVDEELPYPATSGKRIRTLNLIQRLARRHRVTYLCHRNADAAEANRAVAHFGELGIETVLVQRPVPARSGPAFYARLAVNLFSPVPYSVASHDSPELRAAVRQYNASHAVDLWHCEWTPYAAALRELTHARRLVMAHNVESLIWQRYHETEANSLKRWYIGRQWRKFLRFERWAVASADQTVAVSEPDAERFQRDFAARRVAVVDNGVDTAFFRPADTPRQPGRILFLGSLDWRPNLDAITMLLDRIFPAVLAAEPTAKLVLVGRNPPGTLRRRVQSLAAVELHANVADVRPHLAAASILAVPLRIGGGSRLKILEALATGLPVVSTRVGAEGLDLQAGRHLDVVETVEEMAGALVQAMRQPESALNRAQEGRRRVLERYDWDALADKLERVWLGCVGDVRPHRVRSEA